MMHCCTRSQMLRADRTRLGQSHLAHGCAASLHLCRRDQSVPEGVSNPQVMRHRFGDKGFNTCVLEEHDARWFLDVGRTKDWRYLTLTSTSKTASEVRQCALSYSEKLSVCKENES